MPKQLGRFPRQVFNIPQPKSDDCDALLSVMAMCKQSMDKDEQPFVRVVTSAPEPMCVLCTDNHLCDIERFCTDPARFCPLSVDPTFNLGDFSVTVTSFRNLLIKNQRTGKNPVMIGPMLVHRRKLFTDYHFFASSLVSLKPSLCDLQAFGTDGEECLYNAFATEFSRAHHVRCFLHFRDNCKAKLHEMKVSSDSVLEIIQDILGSFLRGKQGLVDACSSEDLRDKLYSMQGRWEIIAPGFFWWFLQHKVPVIQSSMLATVRESAGLGSPPEPFYTNEIESINRVIKQKTSYKSSEWPEFCRLAKELVEDQQSEVEKAVIGVGEYQFCEEFKHLKIPLSKWSSMTKVQRTNYLQSIASLSLEQAMIPPSNKSRTHSAPTSSTKVFKICGHSFNAEKSLLAKDVLQCMFSKAEKLVQGTNSICPSPGTINAKLVESKSGSRPHFVTVKANNKYSCDSDCPMWKCSKICSHTLACAYIDGHLQHFLDQSVTSPSLYELAKSDTTKKAGKKPSKRKASSKSASKAIAELQSIVENLPSSELLIEPHPTISICSSPAVVPSLTGGNSSSIAVLNPPKKSAQILPSSSTVPTRPSTIVVTPSGSNHLTSSTGPILSTPESNSNAALNLQTPGQSSASIGAATSGFSSASTSNQSTSAINSTLPTHLRSEYRMSGIEMNLHPKISISQVNTPSASPSFVPTLSPNISISQVNQQVPTSLPQQTMPISLPNSNPASNSASPLSTNALMALISQILSNNATPGPSTSGTPPVIDPNYLFWVVILSGNISRCQGCSKKILRNSDGKVLPPPNDLVLQHKERVLFNNPKTGMYQLSVDHRNVYYHARLSCVKLKFPSFSPGQHVRVNKDTFVRLTHVHKEFISQEFGIKFSAT